MNILYIANARIPTEKAHGIHIMNMCEALASEGHTVTLFLPKRRTFIREQPFSYYHVAESFSIKRGWCIDLISVAPWLGPFAYAVTVVSFALSAFFFSRRHAFSVFYTRDIYTLLFFSKMMPIVYEMHDMPKKPNRLFLRLLAKADRIVAITDALKQAVAAHGISEDRIMVAPDAVNMDQFALDVSVEDARAQTGLPPTAPIVMYTGHLYPWKGVSTLLGAAKLLPSYLFVCVGGTKQDVETYEERVRTEGVTNIMVLGHKKHEEIPMYLQSADVLLLPNSGTEAISARYTSPMKLFEYMASGRPIVASDLPSLREVLDPETAMLVPPDDSAALARGIEAVVRDQDAARARVKTARVRAKEYTWTARAKRVLSFISGI